MRSGAPLWPVAVGVAWRQPHYQEVMVRGAPGIDFLEVLTEDFLSPGGAARQLLLDAARRFPVSLHGAGLGLGSAVGIDGGHLRQVRELVDAVRPGAVSEYACFNRVHRPGAPIHLHARLPIPFSERSLSLLADHVDTAQEALGRQILIEPIAACLAWDEDTLSEPAFFNALARRTGCGVLVNLDSLVVTAINRGHRDEAIVRAGIAWLDEIDPAVVGQYHLAGHAQAQGVALGGQGDPVGEDVWSLYRHALGRIGARPTVIDRGRPAPPLATLTEEVARARREQQAFDREVIAPPPPRQDRRGRDSFPIQFQESDDDAA